MSRAYSISSHFLSGFVSFLATETRCRANYHTLFINGLFMLITVRYTSRLLEVSWSKVVAALQVTALLAVKVVGQNHFQNDGINYMVSIAAGAVLSPATPGIRN